ncbi:MAG: electron transport complex subunit RsxC [Coriobacteriia bacterium]|nr:electron transport complex subunit RsxC [Coriobacteriia bacterium]
MPTRAFNGGVHPADRKDATSAHPITRAPVPEVLRVPLSQHLGAPCSPLVAKGDRVVRGQVTGDVEAMVSAPVHAPVDGEVTDVGPVVLASGARVVAVSITPDEVQEFDRFEPVERSESVPETVRAAGIVGLGGATFPTSVKLQPPKDMPVGTVILNGCECEPYLTCDHRTMLERPGRVIRGAELIAKAVGATRVVIAVEDNKEDAAVALRAEAGPGIEVLVLPTRYPQGAEKQLIWAVIGGEVPHGKLPAATGALVHNVTTAAAVADAVDEGRPLMERVVTVTGNVRNPGNYLTLLGTPVEALIEAAGGMSGEYGRVVAGGPMTGMALADLSVPVVKGMGGIVVLDSGDTAPAVHGDQPCIRCARCSDACPMMLEPYAIGIYANRSDWDGANRFHALDCIECGCCSFVCPTRRPLVQLIRRAKQVLLEKGASL